jgi:hypothetical protein
VGFQNFEGDSGKGVTATYAKVWTVIRTDWNAEHGGADINQYNRTVCAHAIYTQTYAYVQCRSIIF